MEDLSHRLLYTLYSFVIQGLPLLFYIARKHYCEAGEVGVSRWFWHFMVLDCVFIALAMGNHGSFVFMILPFVPPIFFFAAVAFSRKF